MMKAEYKEGQEASENFERLAKAVFPAKPKHKEQEKAAAQESYLPQNVRQGQGLERFLLPRPCRRMVERVCSLAGQLGIGEALSGDLRHSEMRSGQNRLMGCLW